jgi:hypothetical protein
MEYFLMAVGWALVNYFVSDYVVKKNEGFVANPYLYVCGSLILGGIWPLMFLGCKYLYWKNELKKAELEELKEKVKALEEKDNE